MYRCHLQGSHRRLAKVSSFSFPKSLPKKLKNQENLYEDKFCLPTKCGNRKKRRVKVGPQSWHISIKNHYQIKRFVLTWLSTFQRLRKFQSTIGNKNLWGQKQNIYGFYGRNGQNQEKFRKSVQMTRSQENQSVWHLP